MDNVKTNPAAKQAGEDRLSRDAGMIVKEKEEPSAQVFTAYVYKIDAPEEESSVFGSDEGHMCKRRPSVALIPICESF